jgi:hypothetical protein
MTAKVKFDPETHHPRTGAKRTTTPEQATPRPAPSVAQVLADQKPTETLDRAGNIRPTLPTVPQQALATHAPDFDRATYEQNLRHDTAGIGSIVTYNGKDGGFFSINRNLILPATFLRGRI